MRRRGWSLSDGEAWTGVKGIAVPILHQDGVLVGALAVVGPSKLLAQRQVHEKIGALRAAALDILAKL